jgi:hypothetical protein
MFRKKTDDLSLTAPPTTHRERAGFVPGIGNRGSASSFFYGGLASSLKFYRGYSTMLDYQSLLADCASYNFILSAVFWIYY